MVNCFLSKYYTGGQLSFPYFLKTYPVVTAKLFSTSCWQLTMFQQVNIFSKTLPTKNTPMARVWNARISTQKLYKLTSPVSTQTQPLTAYQNCIMPTGTRFNARGETTLQTNIYTHLPQLRPLLRLHVESVLWLWQSFFLQSQYQIEDKNTK